MEIQGFQKISNEPQVDSSTGAALKEPTASGSIICFPARTSTRAGFRRFKKETLHQKNIIEVQSPLHSLRCSPSPIPSGAKSPNPIDVALVVLFLAKLESILIRIEDKKINPIKGAIIELGKEIISIQQELSYNNAMIEKLQADAMHSKEAETYLVGALKNNQRLIGMLQDRLARHDDMIVQLETEIQKSEGFSQELSEAITENKKIVEQMQNTIHDIEVVENILVKYGNNTDGIPALHAAIKNGDARAVELLINHGADVNAIMTSNISSKNGLTALNFAVLQKNEDIARLLLDKGADIDGGVFNKYVDQFDKKEKIDMATTSIHFAAEVGDVRIIKLLNERGADINTNVSKRPNQNYNFWTPLHIAAKHGHFDAVVALVELGADINSGRVQGRQTSVNTPLDLAAMLTYADNPKNLDLVKFLVEQGAVRNFKDRNFEPCPIIKAYLESKSR